MYLFKNVSHYPYSYKLFGILLSHMMKRKIFFCIYEVKCVFPLLNHPRHRGGRGSGEGGPMDYVGLLTSHFNSSISQMFLEQLPGDGYAHCVLNDYVSINMYRKQTHNIYMCTNYAHFSLNCGSFPYLT